jgi:hypothetical protein
MYSYLIWFAYEFSRRWKDNIKVDLYRMWTEFKWDPVVGFFEEGIERLFP